MRGEGWEPIQPLPFVRDMLGGHLLTSTRGVHFNRPPFCLVLTKTLPGARWRPQEGRGRGSPGPCGHHLPANKPTPIWCAHTAHAAQLRTRDAQTVDTSLVTTSWLPTWLPAVDTSVATLDPYKNPGKERSFTGYLDMLVTPSPPYPMHPLWCATQSARQ